MKPRDAGHASDGKAKHALLRLPECCLGQRWLVAGLGGGVQECGETAAEQVGVAGPVGCQKCAWSVSCIDAPSVSPRT